jgi:hypothetical protein
MQDITWPLPLSAASQSKDVWKGGAVTSPIWELVGVDGTNQGASVPYPGFRESWVFRYENLAGSDFPGNSNVNPYATNTNRAIVLDFWTFTARIGSSKYCYGVVYLAQRPSSTTRDLIIEGYRTDTSAYFQRVLVENSALLGVSTGDYAINVVPTSRVVYVFIRGMAPKAVSWTDSVAALNIVSAGPGSKPLGSWRSTDTTGSYEPTTTLLPDPANGTVGSFVVYGSTTNPYTANYWSDTSARWTTATSQKAGDYSFAVQFEDSNTGRRSQLSDNVAVTFTGANRTFTVVGIVDTAKYDTVKIWRSVRTTNAAGIFTTGILQLEATFLASAYEITTTGPVWSPALAATVKKWAYAVQKDDRQLVMQDTFQDKPAFLDNVPFGGAAVAFQNQLYVSNIQGQAAGTDDQMKSVGEIRWSSASDGSYELFAPKGRWTPDLFGDTPIAFQQAGQMLAGFSGNQIYFIMRDGAFVRVMTAHSGYGVVGPYGASSIGPMIYYVTHQGVRVLYPDGRLDEVGAMDWLISQYWADDLERVSLAFDPRTTALYFLNPVKGKAACLWFASGTVSELHQLPFTKCARALYPRSVGGALEDTALFLLSPTDITHSGSTTGFVARLMQPAKTGLDRVRTPSGANLFEGVHYGLIDGNCDRCVSATITDNTGSIPKSVIVEWNARTNGWTPDWTIIGAYLKIVGDTVSRSTSYADALYYQYTFKIISLAAPSGGKVKVVAVLVADEVTPDVDPGSEIFANPIDVLVAINPVVMKVQTSILPGGQDATGYMLSRQVSSMGAMFSGYQYSNAVDSATGYNQFSRWFANLYKGEGETAYLKGYSYNPSTNDTYKTIVDGQTPVHAAWNQTKTTGTASSMAIGPQWSVEFVAFVVGQTFRLLALNVKGRILDSERSKNSYA